MIKLENWTVVVQRVILGKIQYRIWNAHQISKSKKKILKSVQKQGNNALFKDAKIVMFKMVILTFMYLL